MAASRQADNHNDHDSNDCCGIFKFISRLSFFQPDYSSIAERYKMVSALNTPYDKSIYDLILNADFRFSAFAEYNPPVSQEKPITQANHLIRNALIRSRLFVKNAIAQGLHIPAKNKIFILDVGCENALSLAGIIAYFGEEKVQYVGIDCNETNILQCREIYRNYQNVEFIHADGRQYLNDNRGVFDVILFQHPNLSSLEPSVIINFTSMLIASPRSLAEQGALYVTFYYDCEVEFFNESIKPRIPLEFKSDPVRANQFKSEILVDRRLVVGSNPNKPYVSYSPENFVLASHPKPQLENKMKKSL